jgi:cob(I)alamin adenosyltransferase
VLLALFGSPLVERVWLPLLVPGAVRQLDEPAAVPLVEGAGALVALEHPEAEPLRPALLCAVEQRAADAPPEGLWLDVERLELILSEGGKAEDQPVLLPDPDLPVTHELAEELAILLGRVQRGEEGQGSEGAPEKHCDRRPFLGDRSSDHLRNLRRVSPRERDEPVRLTRIYTRGGDRGETSLGDGSRVSKLDPRIRAYGVVDELNAQLGVAIAGELPRELRDLLERVQNELFDLGADLSVPYEATGRLRVEQRQIDDLERACDEWNASLAPLKSFVLPGGSEAAARLHVARTVCRRAELTALTTASEVPVNPLALVYLNRLSDLLFILARAANAGRDEPLWKPGNSS